MGSVCKGLATLYGVFGSIGTIVMSYSLGKIGAVHRADRTWLLTISVFLGMGLMVAMICVALYTLGDIHEQLQSYTFAGRSGLSDLSGLSEDKETKNKRLLANGGWKCPDCGSIHPSYETTCKCGRSKND